MRQIIFVFVFYSIFSNFTFSQSLSLSGHVLDGKQAPLENAHVHIGNQFGLSAADGWFRLNNISRGEHRVNISFIGFQTLDTIIFLRENTEINFQLKESAANLETILLQETLQRTSSQTTEKVNQ